MIHYRAQSHFDVVTWEDKFYFFVTIEENVHWKVKTQYVEEIDDKVRQFKMDLKKKIV